MEYKVLKDYTGRLGALVKAGEIVTVRHLEDDRFAQGLIRNGFIKEIKDEPWEPKEGETDYYITADGRDGACLYMTKDELEYALRRNEIGNSFPTREQRDKTVEWLKAFKVLQDDTKGFKPDWSEEQGKWTVFYDSRYSILKTNLQSTVNDSLIYFANVADADDSIKNHPKEWLTFYGVEEVK